MLSEKIITKIKAQDFSIFEDEGNKTIDFGKYSPMGQDFHFTVTLDEDDYNDGGLDIEALTEKTWDLYQDFDTSYETYLWLDNTGHGQNGAPYDMRDLYDDMAACREYIKELYELLTE